MADVTEVKRIKVNLDVDPKLDPGNPDFDPDAWKEAMLSFSNRLDDMKKRIADIIVLQHKPNDALTNLSEILSDFASAIVENSITSSAEVIKQVIVDLARLLPDEQEPDSLQMSLFPEDEEQQRLEAEIIDVLPQLQSLIPQKHLIPNNKLANSIVKDMIDAGSIILDVSSAKAKQSIDVICNLVYEGENVKLSGRQSFTEYDRNVYNAVTSLYVYGGKTHVVTPQTVYRAMVGMTDTEDPSPQQIGAVTKSLDKMRFIRATVDCTEELTKRNISLNGEYITNGIIDTYLLNASVIQVRAGGRTVRGYLIEKVPVLYAYSHALKEVFTIPAELLDIKAIDTKGRITKSRISNNESRIQVKGYLLRRIEGLKGKNALKNKTISLQSYEKGGKHHRGLYEIAGLTDRATRKAQKAVRDYAAQALDYWKASGYIKGFSFITAGKTITGINIDP